MLFMVIERFRQGRLKAVGQRLSRIGRLLPATVLYKGSWIESNGARCFQIVEAPDEESLKPWIDAWSDLLDFEVVPVLKSADFWKA